MTMTTDYGPTTPHIEFLESLYYRLLRESRMVRGVEQQAFAEAVVHLKTVFSHINALCDDVKGTIR
jgi:hypothetical protein